MANNMETDLIGLIDCLPHFKNNALLPLFEAIYNSIDAIEDKGDISNGKITVRIIRQPAIDGDKENKEKRDIISFEIEDNGIGFTDENMKSFSTNYSRYKIEKGGRGVGRFCWLKAFERVEIDSIYENDEGRMRRIFNFNLDVTIKQKKHETTDVEPRTIVRLIGFKKEYRKQTSACKTRTKIAQRILEHCLSFLIEEVAPQIILVDEDETESINEMFLEKEDISTEVVTKSDIKFKVTHLKLYSTVATKHNLVLCANKREVIPSDLKRLLGTSKLYDEEDKKFYYSVYVSSPYLDDNVDNSRMAFNIPDKPGTLDADDYPLSLEEINDFVLERAKEYLYDYLEELRQQKRDIIQNYVANENPTLRAVPTYCPEVYDKIELTWADEKINKLLYQYKGKAEYSVRKKSEKLLKTQAKSIEEIKEPYMQLLNELDALQKDQLAGYVLFRKMIIDLLKKNIEFNKDGNYSNEDIIHDIILPRKRKTSELNFEDYNLWVVDERLTFHELASSDERLCDNTSSESKDRPDVVIFSEMGEDRVAKAVSIIEFKKPQRNKYEESPTDQLIRNLRDIQDQKVIMPSGRPLKVNSTTRYYCFALCDMTKKIREFADTHDYAELMGEMGYYIYHRNRNAHIEIIDYDKLIVDVQQRHKAFFEKLGL